MWRFNSIPKLSKFNLHKSRKNQGINVLEAELEAVLLLGDRIL